MDMKIHLFLVLAVCLTLLNFATSQSRNGRKVGFNAGSHFRNEFRGPNGFIEGEYGFRTPDGCMHVVQYEATKNKYRVLGTSKRDCTRKSLSRPGKLPPLLPSLIEKMKQFTPNLSERKPMTTKRPSTTTKRPTTTTRRVIQTSRRPVTTIKKSPTISKKPFTTTQRQTTTTRRTTTKTPITTRRNTTKKPSTTRRTTTTRKPTTKRPVPDRKSNDIIGKQIFDTVDPPPNMKRPKILSPDDPDPVYSFGFEAPGHGHTQAGLPDGRKKGEFFFDSPDGWRRIVTYEARKDGFFPKMSRVRIPGWETSPLNPKNRFRDVAKPKGDANPVTGVDKDNGEPVEEGEPEGKQLIKLPIQGNGCPYYFYTNTRINFHWERCLENGTRVGEYGRLADDGYSHRVKYYADARGFHPKVSQIPLTTEQEETVAGFTKGAFIIPKIDEEKRETERRIQEWISQNQGRIDNPL